MLRQLKTAVEESRPCVSVDLGQYPDTFKHLLYFMLPFTLNIINIEQKHKHNKQHIVKKKKYEPNFIIKYVANLLQNVMFTYSGCLFVRWDTSSEIYDKSVKKKRPDSTICLFDGVEVGCGGIRPPETSSSDVWKKSVAGCPEHLKKQLHKRLQVASKEKDLMTFGFFGFTEEVELSVIQFKKGTYGYLVVKKLKLPTMRG